ncbi:MAG: hypothetical protein RBS99_16585 [Rhodospirillales bacterium]|jgi:hypothetical protein|nr:hypothetical protein [Rhodospirillales bacterium]
MSELMAQLVARLAIHEYLLEVMYANLAVNAEDPVAFAEDFGDHLVARTKSHMASPLDALGIDRDFNAEVQRETIRMMQEFARRMRERAADRATEEA